MMDGLQSTVLGAYLVGWFGGLIGWSGNCTDNE